MAGENRLTQKQQKHLMERLLEAKRKIRNKMHRPIPEPPEVKAARKVLNKWNNTVSTMRAREERKMNAKVRKIEEALYFEDPMKSLRLVKNLEKDAAK